MSNKKREKGRIKRDKRRAAKEAAKAAAEHRERSMKLRRRVLFAIPIATCGLAAGLYWGMQQEQLAGVALLAGAMGFFVLGLGYLGGSVKRRDQGSAGSIDFGRRR